MAELVLCPGTHASLFTLICLLLTNTELYQHARTNNILEFIGQIF